MKLSLRYLSDRVSDETDAYLLLEELRWGKDHARLVCPHCGHDKAWFLAPKDGARGTGMKKADGKRTMSVRRVWKCARCRKQFSVLTGTIFHGTKVPLRTWLMVMVQMCSAKNGISAREVERMHGVTPETAWFMLHRLRESMKRDPLAGMLSGVIVADETFFGGKPKNRHLGQRGGYGKGGRANLPPKTPVLSLIDTASGEVRSVVVPDVTGATLRKAMSEQVDMPNTHLRSDASGGYASFASEFASHESVSHRENEYVRYRDGEAITSNQAEGYFSQLKRSIDGTHHHVSREHLPRYLAEFDFKFSTRKLSDSARMERMIGQVEGRRLTYRPLTER